MHIYQNCLGMIAIFLLAWICSNNKKKIQWRIVLSAFLLQFSLGAIALYIPAGVRIFSWFSDGVIHVLDYAKEGISFVVGPLADFDKFGFIFAIHVLGVLIFFSALLSVLYHLGIMQRIVNLVGGMLGKILGTSRIESLYAVSNVFLGQSESPLAIRPYVAGLTHSELFTAMTCGMAAVAGSILAGYAQLGVQMKFLIAASFMSAPGAILMSKMLIPETKKKEDVTVKIQHEHYVNVLDAIGSGACTGLTIAINIGAMLLAFIAIIALLNGILGYIGSHFGHGHLSMQEILGYLFFPIAWLLGVPWHEALSVGELIGQKIVINEFVAYANMVKHIPVLSSYSESVTTFALCGFANLSSIGIQLAVFENIAPSRRDEVAKLGLKAIFAGTLSNLMSASIAGLFLSLEGLLT